MSIFELIILAFSLSMDAFSVAICNGLSLKKFNLKIASFTSLSFGIFQALMPVIGFYFGKMFYETLSSFDHWIAFILLVILGIKMIREDDECDAKIDFKTIIVNSIATSIDALAVGITFAFLSVNLGLAVSLIGVITFVMSFIGFILGNKLGNKLNKANLVGGIILILIGTKILLEHLGILG